MRTVFDKPATPPDRLKPILSGMPLPHAQRAWIISLFVIFPMLLSGCLFGPSSDEGPPRELVARTTFTYDAQGRLATKILYRGDGTEALREVYTYGANGLPTQLVSTGFGLSGDTVLYSDTTLFSYNAQGQIAESTGADYRNAWTYDELGRLTEASGFDANGELVQKTLFAYDAEENLSETVVLADFDSAPEGVMAHRTIFHYDESGHLAEMTYYNSEDSLYNRTSNEHDTQGRLIRSDLASSDGTLITRHTYDLHENLTEECFYGPDGMPQEKYIYTNAYDGQERLLLQRKYRVDG